jgi:ABC-type branched-subunit amino acid transport system ATPase component
MIEVDGLTNRFGPVTVVGGPGFTVCPRQVTGFLRPNSSGKLWTGPMAHWPEGDVS